MARRTGRSPRAAANAIADGRIPASAVRRDERGHVEAIEFHAAAAGLKANTDPVEALRNRKLGQAAASADLVPSAAAVGAAAPARSGDEGDYLAARAKREGFLAKEAELRYLELIGRLVSSEEVEREVAEIFGQLKSNVFLIADRKAQILAAESDPVRVHRLLSDEFRTVFDEFSGRLAADARAEAPPL